MSAGQQTTPQPVPQPLQPQAVIVTPQTFFEKWKFVITPLTIVLLFMASNKGWLTPEQVETIRPFVGTPSSQDGDTTTETVTVEKKTEPRNPVSDKPVKPELDVQHEISVGYDESKPTVVKALTADDIQRIAKQLIDLWKQLEPLLPNPVPPNPPVPPTPEPTPPSPPGPSSLKILVADETGKPVTAATVDAGALLLVTSSANGVGWQHSRHGTVRLAEMPNGLGYAMSLESGAWCEFFATDYVGKSQVSRRITANQGPIPPPVVPPEPDNPIPPTPEPPTPPAPPPVTSFRVIFVRESGQTLPPAQASVPGAKAVREYLFAKTTRENNITGWREYDPQTDATNEQATLKALWEAVKPKITDVPCMVIEVNGKADILPYPANPAEALATLKQYGGP